MNDSKTAPVQPVAVAETPLDPTTHFQQWLAENNYQIHIEALTENNPFLQGKGFVLTDKPLLVVTIKKKEDKN